MADELKDQRVVTMMTPSELRAIDDWSFANRIRSRGEAIRRLCQIGLAFDASLPDLVQEMEAMAKSGVATTKAFDAWEADETGEIDADAVFVAVGETMGHAMRILQSVAEAGEMRDVWLINDEWEHVDKAAKRLTRRHKIDRET